jgi:predicted NBD/HSP70 family sugar kinase
VNEHAESDGRRGRSLNPATAATVFRLIRERTATSRAELGRHTGLSRTAVAARVTALIETGLVQEGAPPGSSSGVGRPAARLAFDASAGIVLCAAIGRSRTQVGVVDLAGEIVAETEIAQEIGLGPDELLPRVVGALAETLGRARRDVAAVKGVGVSIPGTVDQEHGCSLDSPIMSGWHEVPMAPYFAELTPATVHVENDTNVIALSERDGHLATAPDALIIKASTGFGAGIVTGGVLQHGALGAAGEIGHVKYPPAKGLACRCGETGCLEAVAGGWALVRDLRAVGVDVDHVRDVVTLAMAGDQPARRAVRRSGRHLGSVLATAVTLLNPATVVVGGDMQPAYEPFVAGLRETLYRDATPIATRELTIVAATHGAQAGLRGCAALALDHALDDEVINRLATHAVD